MSTKKGQCEKLQLLIPGTMFDTMLEQVVLLNRCIIPGTWYWYLVATLAAVRVAPVLTETPIPEVLILK